MMDYFKIEVLYSEIANKLNEIIPTKWGRILLYAEIEPGVVSYHYCFYESETGNLIQFADIDKLFPSFEKEFKLKGLELTKIIEKLNNEFTNNKQDRWTNITFILESDGKFNIEYGYEDLYKTDELYRREQWNKKYLNL